MPRRRFLVVDDNRQICDVVADMLGSTGARVVTAFNGADALNLLEKGPLDLAIVDLLFGGPVSSDLVVQLARLKKCPVITMSGTLVSDRHGRDLATPHLTKPFRAEVLVALVEKTLTQHRQPAVLL